MNNHRCACGKFIKFPLYECDECFEKGQREEEASLTQVKQKKVTLKEYGLETEYETKNMKILQFEHLTKQKIYFSKLSDPEDFSDPLASGE